MKGITKERREIVFGGAVLVAGCAVSLLCLLPIMLPGVVPRSFFPTLQQQQFFFDVFGIVGGCWLLSWVSSINQWWGMSKIGQWLGIILLCAVQAILIEIWGETFLASSHAKFGWFAAPGLVQVYLLGCFLGFFTLPALTRSGNRSLTGLGTLLLLLPWLVGRDAVIAGSAYLYGMFT